MQADDQRHLETFNEDDEEAEKIIEAHEMELRKKGLKPEGFVQSMFSLSQMNLESNEDPIRLFAYLR